MRGLLLVLTAVSLVGCGFGATQCKSSADCRGDGVCIDGFCVQHDAGTTGGGGGGGAPSGGGGGGGTPTGGGGGSVGGGGGMPDAGDDAGVDAGPTCDGVMCSPGFSCTAGVCEFRVTSLTIVAPSDGLVAKQAVHDVSAVLQADASIEWPAKLSLELPDGGKTDITGLDGSYLFAAVRFPEGSSRVTVSADFGDAGKLSDTNTIRIDTVAPSLNASVPTAVFMRDDIVTIYVSSDEALQNTPAVTVDGVGAMPSVNCDAGAYCFDVDLSLPTLLGMDGGFEVFAQGTDIAGNTSASTNVGMIKVTRKRWEANLRSMTGEEIYASPSINGVGQVAIGTRIGATDGNLKVVTWQDGGVFGSTAVGAVMSVATAVSSISPSGTGQVVYFAANVVANANLGARALADLSNASASVSPNVVGTPSVSTTYSGLALYEGAGSEVQATAAFNGATSYLARYGTTSVGPTAPSYVTGPADLFDATPTPVPSIVPAPTNLIINGTSNTLYAPTRPLSQGAFIQPVTSIKSTSPMVSTPGTIASSGTLNYLTGLSWSGTEPLASGSGALNSIYRFNSGGPVGSNLSDSADKSPAVVDTMNAFAVSGSTLWGFNPTNISSNGSRGTVGATHTSPILGEPRQGSSSPLGYVVNDNGELWVFDINDTQPAKRYGFVFPAMTPVAAHSNLDCNRRTGNNVATRTTGILYVASTDGRLAAIIVDSPGLKRDAIWPRYQRSASNSGNTTFPTNVNEGCP